MSRNLLTLPFRLVNAAPAVRPWVCRRCIATHADVSPEHISTKLAVPFTETPSKIAVRDQSWVNEWIRKELPHRVPIQYLMYCDPTVLSETERAWRDKYPHADVVHGVVVSCGKMKNTVKVRVKDQKWNKHLHKHFSSTMSYMAHDPNDSVVEGDVVSMHKLRVSSKVNLVVASILSPFGTPINARAPIPSPEERLARYKQKRYRKFYVRALRQDAADGNAEAVTELQKAGLDHRQADASGKKRKQNQQTKSGVTSKSQGDVTSKVKAVEDGDRTASPVNERARRNKAKADDFEARTAENLEQAGRAAAHLEDGGIGADPLSGTTVTRGRDD